MSKTSDMLAALRDGKKCDEDGVMCIVSRQACIEAADEIERLTTLVELQLRKISTQHEDLATFMMKHSFSTGHGDSHADLLAELGPQIDKLRGALAAAQAYARHERDLGAEELAQANAILIQTLQDDLAEAVDAIQPFAKAHQDVLRALVYPNWQWKLPTTDDYETAQAIVEKHKWRSTLQKLKTT